jgi:hypothetical protein
MMFRLVVDQLQAVGLYMPCYAARFVGWGSC